MINPAWDKLKELVFLYTIHNVKFSQLIKFVFIKPAEFRASWTVRVVFSSITLFSWNTDFQYGSQIVIFRKSEQLRYD
jgi:hypothetical protein